MSHCHVLPIGFTYLYLTISLRYTSARIWDASTRYKKILLSKINANGRELTGIDDDFDIFSNKSSVNTENVNISTFVSDLYTWMCYEVERNPCSFKRDIFCFYNNDDFCVQRQTGNVSVFCNISLRSLYFHLLHNNATIRQQILFSAINTKLYVFFFLHRTHNTQP